MIDFCQSPKSWSRLLTEELEKKGLLTKEVIKEGMIGGLGSLVLVFW